MANVMPTGGGTGGAPAATIAQQTTIAIEENGGSGGAVTQNSMQPAFDEPHSNLPFDPRMMRQQFWPGSKPVTGGVLTNDTSPLGGKVPMPQYGLSVTPAPFYCFFLFNPAEIDANYGFDQSGDGMLPVSQVFSQVGNGGGVLTQSISFNLLFDRTYEVWNGPSALPASANYGFAQGEVIAPKNGGPYRYGVLWDVWALERLCGIFRQADGIPPQGPPTVQLLHIRTGGVTIANTTTDNSPSGWTHIDIEPTPTSVDCWGWMQSLSVQYTRFDANMVPTRCAVSLGFQLTYAQPAATTNPAGNNPTGGGG